MRGTEGLGAKRPHGPMARGTVWLEGGLWQGRDWDLRYLGLSALKWGTEDGRWSSRVGDECLVWLATEGLGINSPPCLCCPLDSCGFGNCSFFCGSWWGGRAGSGLMSSPAEGKESEGTEKAPLAVVKIPPPPVAKLQPPPAAPKVPPVSTVNMNGYGTEVKPPSLEEVVCYQAVSGSIFPLLVSPAAERIRFILGEDDDGPPPPSSSPSWMSCWLWTGRRWSGRRRQGERSLGTHTNTHTQNTQARTRTRTRMHTDIHTHAHRHTHTRMPTSTHACTHTHAHTRTHM